ncbi:uncharacterized protein LOC143865838 [Tasmannia lanceolata]|uniref:uncharacterized protein LOC143865791 n=1 Tax=Tasmannia lanceolata TaxID=3420 RepID=UPI00406385F4
MELLFEDEGILKHANNWSNCLIGYFIGKRPYFISLRDSLLRRWQLSGSFQMFTLEHGFLLFKFSSADDCTKVLEIPGQNYGGRPLILQRWDPNSAMEKKKLLDLPIWIKLPGIHLKFWNQHCLSRIASLIGKPLYMDTQTTEASRINFARLCIQVRSNQTLPGTITLKTSKGEIIQSIEYDWKPSYVLIAATLVIEMRTAPFV